MTVKNKTDLGAETANGPTQRPLSHNVIKIRFHIFVAERRIWDIIQTKFLTFQM